jgi:hypothetical protein
MANTKPSISFAQLLLTAIPLSLRQLAVTNAPAVSSILWEEFLDDKKPEWFEELPWDVQSYLIVRFGPETAWPTATPQSTGLLTTATQMASSGTLSSPTLQSSRPTLSASSSIPSSAVRSSATQSSGSPSATASSVGTMSTSKRSFTSSSTPSSSVARPGAAVGPDAPSADDSALSRNQKIGLGVGIPVGILGLAALLFACGLLCRRRRNRRSIDGSERASSPGFIPRFAFQEKSSDHLDHRAPLNPISNTSSRDSGTMNWEDEAYEPYRPSYAYNAHMATSNRPTPASTTTTATPIMAPVLNHTHSSNRARGRRTSYTSLHSVAEMNEPEDMESPILGRHTTPLHRNRRPSLPMVLEMPPAPPMATVKRKPIPESPTGPSPAAQAASASVLRPPRRQSDHSGSSSSGLALSTDSSNCGGYASGPTSPVSPISQLAPTNPFSNDYSYVEDYGPEYQGGYVNQDDGLMGGHRSLDSYPESTPPRRSSSKTEWPLRNFSMGRRSQSPMWDRVYDA